MESVGGARIGWFNASWPLAKLKADAAELSVSIRFFGDYRFRPDQVVALSRYGVIPLLGSGIRIEHSIAEYPAKVVFWCMGNPDALLAEVSHAGFIPQAPGEARLPARGFPLRWPPVIALALIWNVCLLADFSSHFDFPVPGLLSLLAFLVFFLVSLGILYVPAVARVFLKPGRSVEEIRPGVKLVAFIMGVFLLVFGPIRLLALILVAQK